jgi:hypothetical protein
VPGVVQAWLPDSVKVWLAPLSSTPVLLGLAFFGVLVFLASLVGVPYFLTRLPADYFSRRERAALGIPSQPKSLPRLLLGVVKNLLGFVLVLLGIAMLVLPGQGLLTLLIGLMLMDFPGKRRFERWVIARPAVLRTINRLRQRTGRAPIEPRASWLPPSTLPPSEGE